MNQQQRITEAKYQYDLDANGNLWTRPRGDKDEKILALQRTIESRESTMDGYNDSLIKKDQEIKSLTELLCHCPDCDSAPCTMQCANITKAYNQGYMLGHNDTVEGVFQDIPSADMDKRQDHHPKDPTP